MYMNNNSLQVVNLRLHIKCNRSKLMLYNRNIRVYLGILYRTCIDCIDIEELSLVIHSAIISLEIHLEDHLIDFIHQD